MYLTNEQIEEIVNKVMKKVWTRVAEIGLLIIGALIIIQMVMSDAKADESVKVSPTEFVESVVAVPGKVVNHFSNEWEDIKVYQANSWADMKAQFAKNKEQISNLFTNPKDSE
tara:strand:+ start:358 stop:696 length:339 start_codon:yes stop_codon:yes gene_type:complete